MNICIYEFLVYALFIGLGDDGNQEIEQDDDHENCLQVPDQPYEENSKEFFSRLGVIEQPVIVVWSCQVSNRVLKRIEQESERLVDAWV